ncbi:MAG: aminodeoxychorismate lyase [Vibrio sp.]
MIFVNGQPQNHVSIADRSFQYGDGCFTTILVKQGQPQSLSLHQQRIEETCQRLAIALPSWEQIEKWIQQTIQQNNHQHTSLSGVKVHISRGEGGRGYSPLGVTQTLVTTTAFAYPQHYDAWQQDGIKVDFSSVQLGYNPLLAGLKHNNRLEQVLIKKALENQSLAIHDNDTIPVDDVIVCDYHGNLVEMCASNLFWFKGNELFTPNLDQSGVRGTKRQEVLQYAEQQNIKINVGSFQPQTLFESDEIFITNALHGIVPVIKIANTEFKIGTKTRVIQEKLNP